MGSLTIHTNLSNYWLPCVGPILVVKMASGFTDLTSPNISQESHEEEIGEVCVLCVVYVADTPKILVHRRCRCRICKKLRQHPTHCVLRCNHVMSKDWEFCGFCGLDFIKYARLSHHLPNCMYQLLDNDRCTCHPYLRPVLNVIEEWPQANPNTF